MAQKIEIPVSLNAQIDNLKQLRSTLINTLSAAGKDSTLAKTLTKEATTDGVTDSQSWKWLDNQQGITNSSVQQVGSLQMFSASDLFM